jgi:riboflavin kinase / FMN adenylyltransferase
VLIFSSQSSNPLANSLENLRVPTAIALGNFDGLHLGHQAVIQPVLPPNIAPRLTSTLVSFDPHPREFFDQNQRSLLTTLDEKIKILAKMGIAQLVLLDFDRELASLSAVEFMQQILVEKLQAEYISVGFNFHFGAKRLGTVADLKAKWGDRLHITQEVKNQDRRISSSSIRTALEEGNVAAANKLLGRAYSLTGKVVTGDRLGRELGFPTANLELDPRKFLPRFGVYVVWVECDRQRFLGVMNVGVRPTVTGEPKQRIEVHLLNWQGDLYDKELTAELVEFLRPEIKFASLDALKTQIQQDCEKATLFSAAKN